MGTYRKGQKSRKEQWQKNKRKLTKKTKKRVNFINKYMLLNNKDFRHAVKSMSVIIFYRYK